MYGKTFHCFKSESCIEDSPITFSKTRGVNEQLDLQAALLQFNVNRIALFDGSIWYLQQAVRCVEAFDREDV